jgi:hypothetical protein
MVKKINDDKLFKKLWKAKTPRAEIAAYFGVLPGTVDSKARAFGLPRRFGRAGGKMWTPKDIALLKALRAKNVKCAEIAKRLGRSVAAIYHMSAYEGLTTEAFQWTKAQERALRKLWPTHAAVADISRIVKKDRMVLFSKAHLLGLKRPHIRPSNPTKPLAQIPEARGFL